MSASASKYRVAVVVDRTFGQRLTSLARRLHVWICATAENRLAAESSWANQPTYSLESGVTTFDVRDSDSAETMLINVLPEVDLHHGEYSHVPPWQALEVYGVAVTASIRDGLARYGVSEFVDTPDGFVCRRELASR